MGQRTYAHHEDCIYWSLLFYQVHRPYQRLDDDKKIKPQLDLAQLLLDKGVPYTVRNKAGKLPEEIASMEKLKTDFKAMLNARYINKT